MEDDFHIYKDDIIAIINKIYLIVYEYFDLISESEIMQKSNIKDNIVEIGLNTILHIFKINLLVYKSIDIAYLYSQKAYYCYLEYIEQIHNKCMTEELNTKDAVLFLYSKTLLKNEYTDYVELDPRLFAFPKLLDNVLHESLNIIHFVLNFDNVYFTLNERKQICEIHLLSFLLFFLAGTTINYQNVNDTFSYLRIINEKQNISYDNYCLFLREIHNYHTKAFKKIDKISILDICNEDTYLDLSNKEKIKRFMETIFV
jgi:hypothetical protein